MEHSHLLLLLLLNNNIKSTYGWMRRITYNVRIEKKNKYILFDITLVWTKHIGNVAESDLQGNWFCAFFIVMFFVDEE